MTPIAVRIDVSEFLPAEVTAGARVHIAAWVFPPTGAPVDAVVALLHGGSYDKRYFHCRIPGRPGYSVAEALAGRGYCVVLTDHLGVGESSRSPNQMKVTRHVAALANHMAVTEIFRRLRQGSLHDSLAPMPGLLRVGGGHSMGCCQIITQQAEHATYDRILILGYTAIGAHAYVDGRLVGADPGPPDLTQRDYWTTDRSLYRTTFHWDDVPADVLAYDDSLCVDVPYMLLTQCLTAGIVSADAGRIDVPVYICLGERDCSPDPHAEPSYYGRSPYVALHILPRSGHCQTFASSRDEMIERIDRWIQSVPWRVGAS